MKNQVIDFTTFDPETSDFKYTDNVYQTRIGNLLKLNKNQVSRFTDGLDLTQYVKSEEFGGVDVGVETFKNIVSSSLISRGYPISAVGFDVDVYGKGIIKISLDNKIYEFEV